MKKLIGVFFIFSISFSAVSQHLEGEIYEHLDAFTKNPSTTTLSLLSNKVAVLSKKANTENEHIAVVITYCNLGYYNNLYSNQNESITAYETAWKIYETYQFTNYDITSNCLIPLANLYTKTGDFIKAENTIKTYMVKAEENNNSLQIIDGIINLSSLYNSTGKYNAAIKTILKSENLEIIESSELQKLQNNLATSYVGLLDYDTAKKTLQQSLIQFKENHLTTYKSLAFIALQEKNRDEAQQYFNLAKEELLKQKEFSSRALALLYLEEAQLFYQLDEIESTKKSLAKALQALLPFYKEKTFPNENELYAEAIFTSIFDLKAKVTENPVDALTWYELSFFIHKKRFRSWTSQENKILHQAEQKNRTEQCLALLYALYKKTKDKQYLIDAFQFTEEVKSSVLAERLLKNNRINETLDPLLVQEQKLEQRQEIIIDGLVRSQLLKIKDTKELNEDLNKIALQLTSLRKDIKNKYPALNSEISVTKLQQKLKKDNAVMLSYFYGNEHLYVFKLNEAAISLDQVEITADFKTTLQEFLHFFDTPSAINNNINSYTQAAFNVYSNILFHKVESYTNVLVIPDGLLSFVSFESLVSKPVSTINYAEMPFVVKEHNLVYATNATHYFNWKKTREKPSVLGVFPVFPDSNQNLSYSIKEADYIKKSVTATLLFEKKASKANFLITMQNYNVLHLSTHANSGNFVIPASIDFYDDSLFMNEIYATNFSSKSIVLSACETGIGKLQKGEGPLSLARGFQYAGAAELLFTLWKVNDKSSSEVMHFFYNEYQKTNAMAIANTAAKLHYLYDSEISNAKKSPYYWNGFVYYGGFDKPVKTVSFTYLILTGIAFISTLLLFYFRRKRN
ncbi:CHAT domain-containing protein [Cellulophaga sp. F20128]|uniref:CHAT domain-containing protein n=1 Tax=Cellulophaga sp. F20128 TaxID=2926413 RepID=UPI001FF3AEB6|nr:CHAT domain-containing protein [Cellulophaga sp. F20128]MCK0156715.1 CHAT domain-containing protein [Cellulophaga sp. F20128]